MQSLEQTCLRTLENSRFPFSCWLFRCGLMGSKRILISPQAPETRAWSLRPQAHPWFSQHGLAFQLRLLNYPHHNLEKGRLKRSNPHPPHFPTSMRPFSPTHNPTSCHPITGAAEGSVKLPQGICCTLKII